MLIRQEEGMTSLPPHRIAPRTDTITRCLDRPRVTTLLDGPGRVTILRAEGGAGKTTAVTTWLNRRPAGGRTIWITIDRNRRSRRFFWHRFAQQAIDLGLAPAHSALGRLAGGDTADDTSPGVVVDLLNTLPQGLLLVVDDLHLADVSVHRDLVDVLEHAPSLELVGTSRAATPLDTGPAARRLATAVVSSADLALTPAELGELCASADLGLGESELRIVHSLTQGNVLTSRLALGAIAHASPETTGADLGAEVVERVVESVREDFAHSFASPHTYWSALRLSLARPVDRALAEDITGDPRIWESIEAFAEQGIGSVSSTDGRRFFAFHPIMEASLARHAEQELDSDVVRWVRLLTVEHMLRWGDPVEVIRLLLLCGEYDRVWPVFARGFSDLSLHRVDDLIRVFEAVPDEVLRAHGTLAAAYAIELSEREPRPSARVRRLTRWVLEWLDSRQDAPGVLEEFLRAAARFGSLRAARRYEETAEAAARLVERLDDAHGEIWAGVGTAVYAALIQVVLTDILTGRPDTAIVHSNGLLDDPLPARRLHRSGLLAYAHALAGRMPAARAELEAIGDEVRRPWAGSVQAVGWNFARAIGLLEDGESAAAHTALDPLEARAGRFEHWALLAWLRAYIDLVGGQPQTARDELERVLRRAGGRVASIRVTGWLTAVRADLAHACGELAEAERILDDASGEAVSEEVAPVLARARLELSAHRPAHALELVMQTTGAERTVRKTAEADLLMAVAHHRLGAAGPAAQHMARAVTLLERNGLSSPLALVPREDRELLAREVGFGLPQRLANPFSGGTRIALTEQERRVLEALVKDARLADVAAELYVSPNTLKTHLRSIYRKLDVTGRATAVSTALRLGLITGSEV